MALANYTDLKTAVAEWLARPLGPLELVAVLIDGRVRKSEMALLAEAHRLCGCAFDPARIHQLMAAFMEGRGIAAARAGSYFVEPTRRLP